MYHCLILVIFVSLALLASGNELLIENHFDLDSEVASSEKETQSFLTATHGSPYALTLTTFLTDASYLHYVVLTAGHPALNAENIKTAAAQCRSDVGKTNVERSNSAVERVQRLEVVAADTITVSKAQEVVRTIENLQPNSSYDVYFVAEVVGSNGVFGPVQSVLQSKTHSEPPHIDTMAVEPVDATANTMLINATLSTPGRVYFALIPSDDDVQLTIEDLVQNRSVPRVAYTQFTAHTMESHESLSFELYVSGLMSATLYDVFVVTEAPGHGQVRTQVFQYPKKCRTHALPLEIVTLACSPLNASATALDLKFRLKMNQQDLERVNLKTLSYFLYNLHYEVTASSENFTVTSNSALASSNETGSTHSTNDTSVQSGNTTCGIFSTPNFSSVEDFQLWIKESHDTNITGLQSGTLYKVKLRAETAGSNGLYGLQELTTQAMTYEEAPFIVGATIYAINESVDSLAVVVDLQRQQGNIHYILTDQSEAADSLRSVFQQATNLNHLLSLLGDQFSHTFEESAYTIGVFEFYSKEHVSSVDINPNGARTEKRTEKTECEAFTQQFNISGLKDATLYSIVLFPETTRHSQSSGVFGSTFQNVLEARTNENASDIVVHSVGPLYGDLGAIQFEVSMTKPNDILYLCISMVKSSESDQNETLHDCREVEDKHSVETSVPPSDVTIFTVGNLSEDTNYKVNLYAENALRNGVMSLRSENKVVRTHKRAPSVIEATARPIAATISQIEAIVVVEPVSSCIIHYVVREARDSHQTEVQTDVDATTIVQQSFERSEDTRSHFQDRLPSSSSSFICSGNIFYNPNIVDSAKFQVKSLDANTTYDVFIVTEMSRDGKSSGVFGEVVTINVTTHAVAPKLVLVTVDPVDGSTDSIIITANLSHPGVVHYFISDVDFADPAIISKSDAGRSPHELRGEFMVLQEHLLMEIKNGTNDSQPTDPAVFVHNASLSGLKSGTTYHVSLTTETFESHGVFGDFPPPVLVNTHLSPPTIRQETLLIYPVDGSSSALAINFELDRFGDVHYALLFRGLLPDRSQELLAIQEEPQSSKNATNESIAIWPPVISTFNLTQLNGSLLKTATLEELGMGVWINDTISISREQMTRVNTTHKQIDNLPANALFDVCLVTETAASGGILGWPLDGSKTACRRVKTHADYTNQSKLLDEISVLPSSGRTDSVRIILNISKRLDAPLMTNGTILNRFAEATDRVPYFVLIDTHKKANRDLGAYFSHRGEVTSAFKNASPGRGDGVVAAGMLSNISIENASVLTIEQNVFGLDANHDYLLYFAYETSNSNGVFTQVNPHKHRDNDSRTEIEGIAVKTHEVAPRIVKAKAQPTFGSTSRITVKFDIACDSCKSALVHILVFPIDCILTTSVMNTLRLNQLAESETNVTINTKLDSRVNESICTLPLVQKRVEFHMSDRQHNINDLEEEVGEQHVLSANTSYMVLLATETVGAYGVLSSAFEKLQVCTHAIAPKFTKFQMQPRIGSTTELVLTFALDRPGEVHYMLGLSDNAEFNATSPYNISSKGMSNGNRHGRDRDFHNYRLDVVRTRQSVTFSNGEHVELLDFLLPGTSYSLYLVSEALPADHGVYGEIHKLLKVSTFANAPILLTHTAYPTPGSTESITVGFRIDAPGHVYFSIVAVKPWDPAYHVVHGSDKFGNRLALHDQLVTQEFVEVDNASMEHESDSGWREVALKAPQTGVNYTIRIVTETKDSGGIYGTVATHTGVRTHSEAPELVNVSVNPTDARVDSLTVNLTLNDRGHVHYVVVPSKFGSEVPIDDIIHGSTELSVRASGIIHVNITTDQSTSFVITGLTEGTSYNLYFRSETFESYGVFGSWTREAITARTHGLPADILPEALECIVTPSCEDLGREPCSRKVNVCGKCLEGYGMESEEEILEGNQRCVKLTPMRVSRGPTIKINGVTRNPNLQMSDVESEAPNNVELEHESTDEIVLEQEPIDLSLAMDLFETIEEVEKPSNTINEEKTEFNKAQTEPLASQNSSQEALDQPVEGETSVKVADTIEQNPSPSSSEVSKCPSNAQPSASGLCECISNYEVDESGTSCVLSGIITDAENATSTTFDVFNMHHHVTSQST
ncbi:putative fibronectin type III, immunoglobulin-like, fibronectin type III superfamily [Plasmopara halstedii]